MKNVYTKLLTIKLMSSPKMNVKIYFRTAEGEFKLRCNNPTKPFRHNNRVNDTELSKYLKLKEEKADYNLQ